MPLLLQDRVLAAKAMIERLRQTQRAEIINDMETLCEAYISLANWDVEKYKKETSKGTFTLNETSKGTFTLNESENILSSSPPLNRNTTLDFLSNPSECNIAFTQYT